MESNKTASFFFQNLHLLILGLAAIFSGVALFVIATIDRSWLLAFGPTAQIYLTGLENGLIVSTMVLFAFFTYFLIFVKEIEKTENYLNSFFSSLSNVKKNIFILVICFIFAFATHSGNILNGYFNMDDFEIVGINHTHTLSESLLIPHGNDHTMPLFMAEMRALDNLFAQNAIFYNLFFFALFALIPFFTYLIFKRLGLSLLSFFVFLIIFTGATGWADMLTGFNIMTTYMQIILFFAIALWSYLRWADSKKKKYMFLFALFVIFAITVDLPGVWVLPSIFLFILYHYWLQNEIFKIRKGYIINFLKDNFIPLLLLILITISFATFFYITFNILQPDTFLSTLDGTVISESDQRAKYWQPRLLISNFFSLFSFGVSLPVFFPNVEKILAHPSLIENVKLLWPILKLVIVILNALLFWFIFKRGNVQEKKLGIFLLALMFVTITIVIVARPDHELVPNFDYRYAGPTFYAYAIFLALCVSLFLKIKKEYAIKIIIPIVIVIISLNQALGFQADRLREEAKARSKAIVKVDNRLLEEIHILSKKAGPIIIPNLSGASMFEGMQGYTLADYILFFQRNMPVKLVQNKEMTPDVKTHTSETVTSVRNSTSLEFKNAIKKDGGIRNYYTFPSLMRYKNIELPHSQLQPINRDKNREIVIKKNIFDPEKKDEVSFSLYTDNVSGNLELSFSFRNDFNADGKTGRIRIDDYTPYTLKENKRLYHIETSLLQLPSYSLSERISNLTLFVPETKNAFIEKLHFN